MILHSEVRTWTIRNRSNDRTNRERPLIKIKFPQLGYYDNGRRYALKTKLTEIECTSFFCTCFDFEKNQILALTLIRDFSWSFQIEFFSE